MSEFLKSIKTFIWNYFYNIGSSLSQLINVVFFFGDPDESICGKIGKSIENKGVWYYIPFTQWFLDHFAHSIERDEGKDNAFDRKERGFPVE